MPYDVDQESLELMKEATKLLEEKNRKKINKFIQRLKKRNRKMKKYVKKALELGLITKDEIDKYKNKYIDEYGNNGFYELMRCVVIFKDDKETEPIMVSTNEKLLEDRRELRERFKIQIMTPKQALKKLKRIEEEDFLNLLQGAGIAG